MRLYLFLCAILAGLVMPQAYADQVYYCPPKIQCDLDQHKCYAKQHIPEIFEIDRDMYNYPNIMWPGIYTFTQAYGQKDKTINPARPYSPGIITCEYFNNDYPIPMYLHISSIINAYPEKTTQPNKWMFNGDNSAQCAPGGVSSAESCPIHIIN